MAILKKLILAISLLITFFVILIIMFRIFDSSRKKEVKGEIPRLFPILVITPSNDGNNQEGQIIYREKLDQFLVEHQEYTYLVPKGQAEKLNQLIQRKCRQGTNDFDWDSPNPYYAYFKVKQLNNNKQQLEVFCTWDDDRVNVGYYETDGTNIFPKFYKLYFGPGLALMAVPYSFFINIILWLTSYFIYRRYKKRRLSVAVAS